MIKDVSKKIYFHFILTYITVIAIIFLFIGIFTYVKIVNSEADKIINETKRIFQTQTDYLDKQILNLYEQAIALSYNTELKKAQYYSYPDVILNIDVIEEISEQLTITKMNSDFIKEIIIYNQRNETFISGNSIGIKAMVYYNTYFKNFTDDYKTFREKCVESSGNNIQVKKENNEIIVNIKLDFKNDMLNYIYIY